MLSLALLWGVSANAHPPTASIEGLHRTYVTPAPFVRALQPSESPAQHDPTTRWDLVLRNPHLGGLTRIAIEGIEIGEARPHATVTLHDVPPGAYEVAFRTHTGLERTRTVAAQLQH